MTTIQNIVTIVRTLDLLMHALAVTQAGKKIDPAFQNAHTHAVELAQTLMASPQAPTYKDRSDWMEHVSNALSEVDPNWASGPYTVGEAMAVSIRKLANQGGREIFVNVYPKNQLGKAYDTKEEAASVAAGDSPCVKRFREVL